MRMETDEYLTAAEAFPDLCSDFENGHRFSGFDRWQYPFAHLLARAPARKSEPNSGLVYFVKSGDWVKIGVTSNLTRRLAALQTGSPLGIKLLLTLSGGKTLEQKFHQAFRELRHNGEWFWLADSLSRYIDSAHGTNRLAGEVTYAKKSRRLQQKQVS